MKKIIICGLVFLFLISFAFAGDLENAGAKIDFNIDSNIINTGDYFISKDVIAVDSVGYTFEKDYQFIETPICKQWVRNETNPSEFTDTCENWDTEQILDKVVLAKLEFKGCKEGSWYKIYKHDSFTTDKKAIKQGGYVYDKLQCTNNKLSFEVDSFSSYTAEEIDALEAKIFHYYTCDNVSGSTVYDEEGTNDGTKQGGVTFTSGFVGNACEFDGVDGSSIHLSEDFYAEFNDYTFSMNFWAKTDQVTTQAYVIDLYGEMYSRLPANFHVAGDPYNYMGANSNATLVGDWNMVSVVVNSSDGGATSSGTECIYINAELIDCITDSIATGTNDGATFASIGSSRATGSTIAWDGQLDEIGFFTEALTIEEMEIIYNASLDGYHLYNYPTGATPNATYDNVSYLGIGINISDYSTSSSEYVLFDSFTFNTSENSTNLGLLDSLNFVKTTGSGSSDVYMNLTLNDVSLYEGLIRTATKNEAGVSGLPPLLASVSNGEHTINRYIKVDGIGDVNLYNSEASLGQFISTGGSTGRGNLTTVSNTFNSSSFTNVFTKSIEKNVESSTYIGGTFYFTSAGVTDAVCNFVDGGDSPYMVVSLDGVSTRTLSTNYITSPETQTETLNISCKSTNGVSVTINGSFIEADMRDDSSNKINNYFFTNESTNYTSYLDISSGHTDYIKEEIEILNGSNILISQSISFDSQSGSQTPTFHVNVTDASNTQICYFEKERFSDGDIGNVFSYPLCSGLSAGSSYNVTLGIDVAVGESIRIYDESLSIFENTDFNITIKNTPPTIDLTTPTNGSSQQDDILISWDYYDVQDDVSSIVINQTNSTNTTTIFTGNSSTSSYLYNLTGQNDGVVTLNIYATEIGTTELYQVSDMVSFTVVSEYMVEDSYDVGVCPVEDIPTSIMFFTICIILTLFCFIGFAFRSPLVIILSGLGIAFSSLYIVGCMGSMGYIFMGLGIGTMLYATFMKF